MRENNNLKLKKVTENKKVFIALFFDIAICENPTFYGYEIMRKVLDIVRGICNYKVEIYHGDLSEKVRYIDITQYIIRNEFLTVEKNTEFKDWPYCIAIDCVDINNIKEIDLLIRKKEISFKGLTEIRKETIDSCKQFYSRLVKVAILDSKNIIVFNDNESDDTIIESIAKEKGYKVIRKQNTFDFCMNNVLDVSKPLTRNLMTLNFSLNIELRIAGAFIWESIEKLSIINFGKTFAGKNIMYPENAFLCLYNASQGIERLQKILIELIIKRKGITNLKDEERVCYLLSSHKYEALNVYIEESLEDFKIDHNCRKLIQTLSSFYNHNRYINFGTERIENCEKFVELLLDFCENNDSNTADSIKKCFGVSLGKYSKLLFNNIKKEVYKLNIYLDELEGRSKAEKVFLDNETNLYKIYEKNLTCKKEIIFWLIKNCKFILKNNIFDIEALDIDSALIFDYLDAIITNCESGLYDEVDCLYDEECSRSKVKFKERLEFMNLLFQYLKF